MRTLLHNLQLIEEAVLHRQQEYRTLLQAKRILEPELTDQINWQLASYKAVKDYGRQLLKNEIQQVEEELFSDPVHQSFRQKIHSFFKF